MDDKMLRAEFKMPLIVRPAHIDGMGHVSNLVYLQWVLDVATAHSASVGYDEERYIREGVAFVVKRHEIDYLRAAMEGDALTLETWVTEWTRVSCLRHTRILRGDEELARAVTTWVFIERKSGRPQRFSNAVKEAFLGRSALEFDSQRMKRLNP